jgi:crotonobetainyl-CoA:carnitine CoA-transferase CaiB-like acyl-CoA transferase
MRVLEDVDACVTPVLTPAAALAHPHHAARGLVHRRGDVTEVGPLARIGEARWQDRAAPRCGEHTRSVLAGLGFGQTEIEQLLANGVVRAG